MKSLVVLCAVIASVAAAPLLVQPQNFPVVVLDPLGRPPDTAEVRPARALHYQTKALEGHILKRRSVDYAVTYTVPAAASHQSRVDVRTSPTVMAAPVVADAVLADPVVQARAVLAPAATLYTGASAVPHQSKIDARTSPSMIAATPVVAEPVVGAYSVNAVPVHTLYAGDSAVSHQSRVDLHTSPAVVTEQVVAPADLAARSVLTPSIYAW